MSRISCVMPDAYASILPLLVGTTAMFEVIAPSIAFSVETTGWPLLDLTVKPLQKALPPALSNLLRPNLKLFLRGFWTANV
jgi:hypothetical protein